MTSAKTSVSSSAAEVIVNARWEVRPIEMPGVPGTATPWESSSLVWTPTSQKKLGMLRPVCGPPRRIGRPLAARPPATTIALLAWLAGAGIGRRAASRWNRVRLLGRGPEGGREAVEEGHLRGREALDAIAVVEGLLLGRDGRRRARVVDPDQVVEDAARFALGEAAPELGQEARVLELAAAADPEARHLELADREGVRVGPRLRDAAEIFERAAARIGRHLGDEAVHAVAEGERGAAVASREATEILRQLGVGRGVAPGVEIHGEEVRTHCRQLGEAATRGASEEVHLEETILRLDVPGRVGGGDDGIRTHAGDEEMRHAVGVADDLHLARTVAAQRRGDEDQQR